MTFTMTPDTESSTGQDTAHQHGWTIESAHTSSEGRVLYMLCPAPCGARRVELRTSPNSAAIAVSKEVTAGHVA
ncbi:hypothetical protein [Arthrobacter sp. HLT1-20]